MRKELWKQNGKKEYANKLRRARRKKKGRQGEQSGEIIIEQRADGKRNIGGKKKG